jgi:hypothetical protein
MSPDTVARTWRDSVLDAVVRLASRRGGDTIERQVPLPLSRPLFETGYWSLTDDLTVLRRSATPAHTIEMLLPETMSFRRPAARSPDAGYIHQHRLKHGFAVGEPPRS